MQQPLKTITVFHFGRYVPSNYLITANLDGALVDLSNRYWRWETSKYMVAHNMTKSLIFGLSLKLGNFKNLPKVPSLIHHIEVDMVKINFTLGSCNTDLTWPVAEINLSL